MVIQREAEVTRAIGALATQFATFLSQDASADYSDITPWLRTRQPEHAKVARNPTARGNSALQDRVAPVGEGSDDPASLMP
jgi:hypothetical protein